MQVVVEGLQGADGFVGSRFDVFEYREFGIGQNTVMVHVLPRQTFEASADVGRVVRQVEFGTCRDGKSYDNSRNGGVYSGIQEKIPYDDTEEDIE